MAVYGAGCSVGDHLLYTGEMDMQTYKNIGYAYRYLERIEPYCYGGVSTATIGVWLSESMDDNIGLSMILLESQIDFEVIRDCGFSRFDTVIFPGGAILNEKELESLQAYLQHGGKVLFVGDSLIKDGELQIDCGLTAPKAAPFGGDYIDAEPLGAEELPQSPFYSYHYSRQGCRLRSERPAVTQGRIRRKVLTGLQDHYRGQRLGVLCVQSGRELGLCSLLCASLHLVGTSPKRASQWAVSNLCSEGRVH